MFEKITNRVSRLPCALGFILLLAMCPAQAEAQRVAEDGSTHRAGRGILRDTVQRTSQGPTRHIAIVAAASGDINDPFFTEPRDTLLASGQFTSVTTVDAASATPQLADLQNYDAVVVWSNLDFNDPELLGDRLAAYVNTGGGVVLTVFANSSATSARFLTGDWATAGHDIIPAAGGTTTGLAALGTVHLPAHPLVVGVSTFSGGTNSFRPTNTSLASAAMVVAEWDDGATLVAVREDTVGARVDLGFYPPSDAIPGFGGLFWDSTTDGGQLLVNALVFAADRVPLTPGDTDGDGDVDQDDAAQFDPCFTGEDMGPPPADCATFDFDDDGDVDCADWSEFLLAFSVPGRPVSSNCTIPTLSEWGLLAMSLFILAAGTWVVAHRRPIT